MSESPQPTSPQDVLAEAVEGEEMDVLPVLAGEPQVVRAQPVQDALPQRPAGAVMPAVQAAAVAAGGFVAGAAVVGLVHRRRQRSSALGKRRRAGRVGNRARSTGPRGTGRAAELAQIVGSRSFLVDVHLLGGSSDR
ncbi:MAG: hypothetical protein ACLQBY_08970 [Solirubrobacteraceae bacterium]